MDPTLVLRLLKIRLLRLIDGPLQKLHRFHRVHRLHRCHLIHFIEFIEFIDFIGTTLFDFIDGQKLTSTACRWTPAQKFTSTGFKIHFYRVQMTTSAVEVKNWVLLTTRFVIPNPDRTDATLRFLNFHFWIFEFTKTNMKVLLFSWGPITILHNK